MLEILYRDQYLIAIHKPSGLLVHRSVIDRHETRFAVQLLRDQIGQRVFPVHRLDKGTSGVLLFALDRSTNAAMTEAFTQGGVRKHYLAIVRGYPADSGLIDHALGRCEDPYLHGGTAATGPAHETTSEPLPEDLEPQSSSFPQQAARTAFATLARVEVPIAVDRYPNSRYAMVALQPLTGRRHQLRRHLKHIAHPIIGDSSYGKGTHNRFFKTHFNSQRMLLACRSLHFEHPYSRTQMTLHAPLAADFAHVIGALGWSEPEPAEIVRRLDQALA